MGRMDEALAPEHQAQIINCLEATGLSVGLLVNFGGPRLEYKRCYRPGTTALPGDADG